MRLAVASIILLFAWWGTSHAMSSPDNLFLCNNSYATSAIPFTANLKTCGPSCNGYWVCLSGGNFSSVTYTGPSNQAFIGANGAAISTTNKIFFAGGHDEIIAGPTYGTIEVYNSDLNKWDVISLSTPRSHLAGAKAGNKVLFAGGQDGVAGAGGYGPKVSTYYDNIDIYDTASYSMTTGRLSEARANIASASIGNKAFFIGGKKPPQVIPKKLIYMMHFQTHGLYWRYLIQGLMQVQP